jgi:tetratricopeptide (TPR) repeat protein
VPFWGRALQAGVWAGAGFLLFTGVFQPLQANRACCAGERLLATEPRRAVASLERAVALDPGNELYWVKLGTLAELNVGATPDSAERRRFLGLAQTAFERACRLVPADAAHHARLGRILGQRAHDGLASPAQAFAELDAALAQDPANAYFYADAGQTALLLGDGGRVRAYALRGLGLYPRFAPLWTQLGCLAAQEKRPEQVERLLAEAVSADWHGDETGLVLALSLRAAALLQLQRFEEARHAAQCVLERRPEDVDARFMLAAALEMLGRRTEALAEYRRVLAERPGHEYARQALRRLDGENTVRSSSSAFMSGSFATEVVGDVTGERIVLPVPARLQ